MAHDNIWQMSSSDDSRYETCPAGNHPATIVGLFDIGTQTVPVSERYRKSPGETTRDVHQLVIVYELAERKTDGDAFRMIQRLTWSLGQKSKLYELVTNVLGLPPKYGFDPRRLVGMSVLVNIMHETSGDKTYARLGSVSQIPKGLTVPKPMVKPVAWSVRSGEDRPANLDWVPFIYGDPIEALISQAAEWKDRVAIAAITNVEDDPIPF